MGVSEYIYSKSGSISYGSWNHLALTYDGQTVKLYVNGVAVASKNSAGVLGTDILQSVFIGKYSNTQIYKGQIDQLKLYGKVLTDSEIASHYQNP